MSTLQAFQKLGRMRVSEVLFRTRQESWKWLDRARVRADRRGATRSSWVPGTGSPAGPFFEGANDVGTAAFVAERDPAAAQRVIAAADRARRGQFDFLGYEGLEFGDPIDWHLDPVSGIRSPLVHWSALRPLDRAQVGDSKVVWELNRHQWLVTLAQAYRLTGDETYADTCAARLASWLAANPRSVGINWASSLELALRLIAWCWVLALAGGSRAFAGGLRARVVACARDHANHVLRNLSRYFSPNTHLTGEALGLLYAGVFMSDAPEAMEWRGTGAAVLAEQLPRQVDADGLYFEHATCYQRYTAEIALHHLILASRAGIPVADEVVASTTRLLDALLVLRRPDGTLLPMGDADGGWLLPLDARAPGDCRGVFAIAAAWFGRPDYLWAAGGIAGEAAWLLGPTVLERDDRLRPEPPAGRASRAFPRAGYAVMRSDWGPRAQQLVLDAAPLGCPVSGGHGHADLLSVQCAAFGRAAVVDAGTGSYTGDAAARAFFRSTAAHSTVRVDGRDQAQGAGPFAWAGRPAARLVRWWAGDEYDAAQGEHEAYAAPARPLRHRRSVVFARRAAFWLLRDEIDGTGTHDVELTFQLAPGRVRACGDWMVWRDAEAGLALRVIAGVPVATRSYEGASEPMRGWESPVYGRWRPAPALVTTCRETLPLRILTVLLPLADDTTPLPELTTIWAASGDPVGVRLAGHDSAVRLDDEAVWTR